MRASSERRLRSTWSLRARALIRAGVPCEIAGSRAFFDKPAVRAALAYMRLALNEADDAALLECINVMTAEFTRESDREALTDTMVGLYHTLLMQKIRSSKRLARASQRSSAPLMLP